MKLNNRFIPSTPAFEFIMRLFRSNSLSSGDHRITALYDTIDDSEIYEIAKNHSIKSSTAHALIDSLGERRVERLWKDIYSKTERRVSNYFEELERIADEFSGDNIKVVLLENGAIARTVYKYWGSYEFGDFDLLILPEQIPSAHQRLLDLGYTELSQNNQTPSNQNFSGSVRREYKRTIDDLYSLRINLQNSLVARKWFKTNNEPDIKRLFDRSVPVSDSNLRVLNPTDNLFQLCIHNASHCYIRDPGLRLHIDIERFIRYGPDIEWEKFAQMVKKYRVNTSCYFSLYIPKILFNTPIPFKVLDEISPPIWKERIIGNWIKKNGLLNGNKRKFTKIGLILFTALLYDKSGDLISDIFPTTDWMYRHYNIHKKYMIPVYYIRRLAAMISDG